MGTIPNAENHIHLVLDNRLPIDKDIKDKEYSDYLRDSAYIFKDGNEEYVDLFLGKVGINANKWGLGLDGFDRAIDASVGLKLLIDPDKKVHDSNEDGTGKYSTDYIKQNENDLYGGVITRVKKYDLDHDGRNDYARAIVHLDTEAGKQRFKNALAAGLNETSPTVDALDPTERWDRLNNVKFINIVMIKNGAYKEYAKIQGLCKGSQTSCGNALAASLNLPEFFNEKNDGSLMHVLGDNTRMGNESTDNSQVGGQPAGQPAGQPVINIYGNQGKDVTNKETDKPQTPELSENEKLLQAKVEELSKALKSSVSQNVENIHSELAPLELFENAEEQKAALKILGDNLDNLNYLKNAMTVLTPKMIAYYNKVNSGKKNDESTNTAKDESAKTNPAVATLPSFDNSPSQTKTDDYTKALANKSLQELLQMNIKLQRGNKA